jgi:hypothetical protein
MSDHNVLVLDLEKPATIYGLIALETELNQLHKLFIEQGLFFKNIFPEWISDAELFALKEHVPRQSPNASHISRTYWKSTILVEDIQKIEDKIKIILTKWNHFLNIDTNTGNQRLPKIDSDYETRITPLNRDLRTLCNNIFKVCKYLTGYLVYSQMLCKPMNAPLDDLLKQLKM